MGPLRTAVDNALLRFDDKLHALELVLAELRGAADARNNQPLGLPSPLRPRSHVN